MPVSSPNLIFRVTASMICQISMYIKHNRHQIESRAQNKFNIYLLKIKFLSELEKTCSEGFSAGPEEDNLFKWNVTVLGPQGTF